MSTMHETEYARTGVHVASPSDEPGGWQWFAGITLMVAAVMRFFDAIWAWTYKGAVSENLQNALFGHSLSTYGWLWMGVAIVLVVCGLGVLVRSQISRWVGIVAGAFAAISAIWWMPYYPIWSLLYVALGVLVVYALAAHGARHTTA